MIKKILKTVRGFSPVELVIMVGFAALAAGALIFLATTPQQMAQTDPVNINIKVDGATTASKGAVATSPKTSSRQPFAQAADFDPSNVDYPKPKTNSKWMKWGKPTNLASETSLKDTPNPGGNNVKVVSDDYIVIHPLPKPVVGTNSNAEANYLQWAVDNVKKKSDGTPGTVQIEMTDVKGAYRPLDLGGRTVVVLNDVNIVGVKSSTLNADQWTEGSSENKNFVIKLNGLESTIKSDRAVIYNGTIEFGWIDVDLSDPNNPVTTSSPAIYDVTVQSLRFEKSPTVAIMSQSAKKITIKDNVVTYPVPGNPPDWFHGYYEAEGIVVLGAYGGVGEGAAIQNNYVDMLGDDSASEPVVSWTDESRCDGIAVYAIPPEEGVTKYLDIKNNVIKNAAWSGLFLLSPAGAETVVDGNTISTRQFPNIVDAGGNQLSWGVGIDFINESDSPAKAAITNNTMTGIIGSGMFLVGLENSVIYGNNIAKVLLQTPEGEKAYKISQLWGPSMFSGITLLGVFGTAIVNNTISGVSAYALSADWTGFNYVDGNNLAGFTPAGSSAMPSSDIWPYDPGYIFLSMFTFGNFVSADDLQCSDVQDYGPPWDIVPVPNTVIASGEFCGAPEE